MNKKIIISLLLMAALSLALPVGFAQKKDGKAASSKFGNTELIAADQLKDYLYFVASDEMEGRDTPSRGLDLTAKFLALNLSRWGVKPAGDDGTYFQRITLRRSQVEPAQSKAEINGQPFNYGEGFLIGVESLAMMMNIPPTAGTASGNLVYAGHGWVAGSKGIDAYKGVEVKDKIVVIHSGAVPKGLGFNEIMQPARHQIENPLSYARKHGAKGIIMIPPSSRLAMWDTVRQNSNRPRSWSFGDENAGVPAMTASAAMLRTLFDGEKFDSEAILKKADNQEFADAFELSAGKKATFTVGVKTETAPTQNVVGVIEGADPVLKNEYVAVGAHYDHIGMRLSSDGDRIYNGADDDGSGTVAVLAMAEAFAKGARPKRSLLFVWHCGEEKGLWGSEYFADHPTVPLNQIITQLNIDMIGRSKVEVPAGTNGNAAAVPGSSAHPANRELSGAHEIYVIGSKMMSSELGNLSESVNNSFLKLAFNYKYDDPNDPNRFFFRSDHFNYAQKGIPIIFYFDGVHEDYHKVSDHPDKIDYQKMEKVTRTIYATAWELANTAKRPAVDKQLPKELTRGG